MILTDTNTEPYCLLAFKKQEHEDICKEANANKVRLNEVSVLICTEDRGLSYVSDKIEDKLLEVPYIDMQAFSRSGTSLETLLDKVRAVPTKYVMISTQGLAFSREFDASKVLNSYNCSVLFGAGCREICHYFDIWETAPEMYGLEGWKNRDEKGTWCFTNPTCFLGEKQAVQKLLEKAISVVGPWGYRMQEDYFIFQYKLRKAISLVQGAEIDFRRDFVACLSHIDVDKENNAWVVKRDFRRQRIND